MQLYLQIKSFKISLKHKSSQIFILGIMSSYFLNTAAIHGNMAGAAIFLCIAL